MDFFTSAALAASFAGLFLVFAFLPAQNYASVTVSELSKNCRGAVHLVGIVNDTSLSKEAMVAQLREGNAYVMVLLKQAPASIGDNITVTGKASRFNGRCWVFEGDKGD
jgi:hypothetical protein